MKKFFKKLKIRPRLNLIISKKQIIIAGLTLILGVAVYANYLLGSNEIELMPAEGEEKYGDAQFVSGGNATPIDSTDVYFARARLDKQESRDEAKEFLQAMLIGENTPEARQVIAQSVGRLSSFIESESKVETVLRAKGFEDVLCYLSDKGANILVKSDGALTPEDAAKIKSVLLSEITIPAENITIVEVK